MQSIADGTVTIVRYNLHRDGGKHGIEYENFLSRQGDESYKCIQSSLVFHCVKNGYYFDNLKKQDTDLPRAGVVYDLDNSMLYVCYFFR